MWATNGLGPTLLVQAALPHLIVSRGGLAVLSPSPHRGHRTASGSALPAALTAGYDSTFPMMFYGTDLRRPAVDVSAVFGNYYDCKD